MERVAKRLITPALIAWIFCPPVGLAGLLNLWLAISRLHKGETIAGARSLDLAKSWIRTAIYITLAVLTVSSVVMYLIGPRFVPPMGSFY